MRIVMSKNKPLETRITESSIPSISIYKKKTKTILKF